MLNFVVDDPRYLADYALTYLSLTTGVSASVFFLVLFWFLNRPLPLVMEPISGKQITGLTLMILLIAIFTHNMRHANSEKMLTLDSAFLISTKLATDDLLRSKEKLHTSYERFPLSRIEPPKRLNIVLIINESWGKNALPFYGNPSNAVPFLSEWVRRESDHFFVFKTAVANSTATDVSMPSILTGVAPYESNDKLHMFPLLWDWGASAGYHSILVTSQRFSWNSLDNFFLSPGPDSYFNGPDMDTPVVNDMGVDDLIAVDFFINALKAFPSDQPFLAIFNSNALHHPYQQNSVRLPKQPDFGDAYENGLFIIDRTIEEIYRYIDKTDRLDNTVFILTGDHAIGVSPNAHLPRIYSFYDESIIVPFLVRVPEPWIRNHPIERMALQQNVNRIVENIDIVPTIVHLIRANESPENDHIAEQLKGHSVLSVIGSERIAISLNRNEVKKMDIAGFGIYFGQKRFVFSDVEEPQFFSVNTDPTQQNNIWSSIDQNDRNIIDNTISQYPILQKIIKEKIGTSALP